MCASETARMTFTVYLATTDHRMTLALPVKTLALDCTMELPLTGEVCFFAISISLALCGGISGDAPDTKPKVVSVVFRRPL